MELVLEHLQDLTAAEETIKQLEQELASEREQNAILRSNLAQQKQNNQSLKETNTNLTQKLSQHEQNASGSFGKWFQVYVRIF